MSPEEFLEREGYRRCDIPACNCGSWHKHDDVLVGTEVSNKLAMSRDRARVVLAEWEAALGIYPENDGVPPVITLVEITRRMARQHEAYERTLAKIMHMVESVLINKPSPVEALYECGSTRTDVPSTDG